MVPLNIRNLDIGPKIFCSYRSKDVSQVGSVRLRTSAVDTLNVLMYASDTDGQPVRLLTTVVALNLQVSYAHVSSLAGRSSLEHLASE